MRWVQDTGTRSDGMKRKKVSGLLDNFVRGSAGGGLIEQLRAQQNEIDELNRRMTQVETGLLQAVQ